MSGEYGGAGEYGAPRPQPQVQVQYVQPVPMQALGQSSTADPYGAPGAPVAYPPGMQQAPVQSVTVITMQQEKPPKPNRGQNGYWRFLIGFLIAFFFNWIGLIIMCAAFRPKSFKMGAQAGFGADFLCAGIVLLAYMGDALSVTAAAGSGGGVIGGLFAGLASVGIYVGMAFGAIFVIVGLPLFVTGIVYYTRRHEGKRQGCCY